MADRDRRRGRYRVTVGASDGQSTTTETVLVVLKRANRPPVIDCGDGVEVKEGDEVDLHDSCTVKDEDDTEIVVTYGGWMSGWRYTTTYDDEGDHVVRITASDKRDGAILTVSQDVIVRVTDVNREPQFADSFPSAISAVENDVITLPAGSISDPDGDKVSVTYSEPFDANGVWRTKPVTPERTMSMSSRATAWSREAHRARVGRPAQHGPDAQVHQADRRG